MSRIMGIWVQTKTSQQNVQSVQIELFAVMFLIPIICVKKTHLPFIAHLPWG